MPEPLAFAVVLLQSALPEGAGGAVSPGAAHQRVLVAGQPRWLAIAAGDAGASSLPGTEEEIVPLELARVLASNGGGEDAYWRSAAFKTSAAAAAVRLVLRSVELLGGNAALPEVLQPALQVLHGIVSAAEAAQQQPNGVRPTGGKKQHKKAAAAAAPAAASAAILAPGLVALCRRAGGGAGGRGWARRRARGGPRTTCSCSRWLRRRASTRGLRRTLCLARIMTPTGAGAAGLHRQTNNGSVLVLPRTAGAVCEGRPS